MNWLFTSNRYIKYNFLTKRGILLVLSITIIHGLLQVFVIGINYLGRLWGESEVAYSISELDIIRTRAHDGGLLIYLWIFAVLLDTAFLYKNQLFQRFMLNGNNRVQWGNFLLCNIFIVSFFMAVLHIAFVNGLGIYFYDIYYLLNFGFLAKLWASLLFAGLFALLLTSLAPSFLTPLFFFGWVIIEQVLNHAMISNQLNQLPQYLPFKLLSAWTYASDPSATASIVLAVYFLLMLSFLYFTINKKSYVQV